jgi:hypothetical protein
MDPRPDDETKAGASDAPGEPHPKDTEVESARLLANEAAPRLEREVMDADEVRRAADSFIAAGNEGDVDRFIHWVRQRREPQGDTGA